MLFSGELEVPRDENKHAAGGSRGLAIDGGDAMLALLEGKAGELGDDVLRPLDLLTFEGQHRPVLIQSSEVGAIGIEGGVVVLHEGLCYRVWIHPHQILSLLPLSLSSSFLLKTNARESLWRG